MRVAYLIAGAGGMYCGSCLRDNRLAATLIEQGSDVLLLPLYTPIKTDEPSVSQSQVHFGGINVYLQQRLPLFRGTPRLFDRLLNMPFLLRWASGWAAKTTAQDLGSLSVGVLEGPNGPQRKELTKLVDGLRAIQPTVVHLPNLLFAGLAQTLREELGTAIFCTLSGEDIFIDGLPEPYRARVLELIQSAAPNVDAFVAPTRYYADEASSRFGLPAERIAYVPMGVRTSDFGEPAATNDNPFTIGYLARICPEKGLLELVRAFCKLRADGRGVRLRIAGYLSQGDRTYWHDIERMIEQQHASADVDFLGEVTRGQKIEMLRSLHVLSVPTVYPEPKGLYILEAMASGVPVVQPRHGAFEELVEATGGGRTYEMARPDALAQAIAELMDQPSLRAEMAKRGRKAVRESFTDEIMAREMWAVYERIAAHG